MDFCAHRKERRRFLLPLASLLLLSFHALAETAADTPQATLGRFAENFPHWYMSQEPFRVIGPVYYVGSRGLSAFLITTGEGHILIDGGAPETAAMIADNIQSLGHSLEDVKILLNTHAHFDHSGGLAELKARSGATLYASTGDVSALQGGFYLGYEGRAEFAAPPVAVDRVLRDGQQVELGEMKLTALLTPGHSRGCTSWRFTVEEDNIPYSVLVFGSATVAANRLFAPPQYAGIVGDYQYTFRTASTWRPDVFLSNHTEAFAMAAKRARQLAGEPLAFVDKLEFPRYINAARLSFEGKLLQARQAAGGDPPGH